MASDIDFINYVIDQLNGIGIITSKKNVWRVYGLCEPKACNWCM